MPVSTEMCSQKYESHGSQELEWLAFDVTARPRLKLGNLTHAIAR